MLPFPIFEIKNEHPLVTSDQEKLIIEPVLLTTKFVGLATTITPLLDE